MKKSLISKGVCFACIGLASCLLFVLPAFARTLSEAQVNGLIADLQKDIREHGYHFTVGKTSVIGYPVDELCKLDLDEERRNAAPREPSGLAKREAALPAAFDWNAQGKCTPVKDQGMCGSCWAFASVGSYESALSALLNIKVDLAEQYLVQCTKAGNGCDGGSCAFWTMATGLPLENCAPYMGADPGCSCPKFYPVQSY
jgi:C1A family cysteine protease